MKRRRHRTTFEGNKEQVEVKADGGVKQDRFSELVWEDRGNDNVKSILLTLMNDTRGYSRSVGVWKVGESRKE